MIWITLYVTWTAAVARTRLSDSDLDLSFTNSSVICGSFYERSFEQSRTISRVRRCVRTFLEDALAGRLSSAVEGSLLSAWFCL